jgi:hypothetical protein
MPAFIDTGLNVVDVRDTALGHLLACERGRSGERYILGSENLTLAQSRFSGNWPKLQGGRLPVFACRMLLPGAPARSARHGPV